MKVKLLRLPPKKRLFNIVSLALTTYVMVLRVGGYILP